MRTPILASVPHGGWKIAEEVKGIWALSEQDAFYDGDPCTARIYDLSDRITAQITMEYYRAVVDLDRAPDDIAPRNPDGVIKSHTRQNVEIYKPGCLPEEDLKRRLLDKYYYPYHRMLQDSLARDDVRMGVDCHSMAAISPTAENVVGMVRPLICLGNLGDEKGVAAPPRHRVTCPPEMIQFMRDEFTKVLQHEDVQLDVPSICTLNVPVAGGYITQQMANKGIPFVQIEISDALYLRSSYFDQQKLILDERRTRDLNTKIWKVLKATASYL